MALLYKALSYGGFVFFTLLALSFLYVSDAPAQPPRALEWVVESGFLRDFLEHQERAALKSVMSSAQEWDAPCQSTISSYCLLNRSYQKDWSDCQKFWWTALRIAPRPLMRLEKHKNFLNSLPRSQLFQLATEASAWHYKVWQTKKNLDALEILHRQTFLGCVLSYVFSKKQTFLSKQGLGLSYHVRRNVMQNFSPVFQWSFQAFATTSFPPQDYDGVQRFSETVRHIENFFEQHTLKSLSKSVTSVCRLLSDHTQHLNKVREESERIFLVQWILFCDQWIDSVFEYHAQQVGPALIRTDIAQRLSGNPIWSALSGRSEF